MTAPGPSAAGPAGHGAHREEFGAQSGEPGRPVRATGEAAAALLAAGIGVLALGGASLLAAYQPFEQALGDASRLFVPGGARLGRYGGQELLALIAWLGSWAILHQRFRLRQVGLTGVAALLVVCLVLGTVLFWSPIVRSLAVLGRH